MQMYTIPTIDELTDPFGGSFIVFIDRSSYFFEWLDELFVSFGTSDTTISAKYVGHVEYEPWADDAQFKFGTVDTLSMHDVWNADGSVVELGHADLRSMKDLDLTVEEGISFTLSGSWDSDLWFGELEIGHLSGGHDNKVWVDELENALMIEGDHQDVTVDEGEDTKIILGEGTGNSFHGEDMDGATIEILDDAQSAAVTAENGNVTYYVDGQDSVVRDGDGNSVFNLSAGNGLTMVHGSDGDDTFNVEMDEADDVIIAGGEGEDTFVFDFSTSEHASADVVVMDFEQGEDTLALEMPGIAVEGVMAETFWSMYASGDTLQLGDASITLYGDVA